MAGAIAMRTKLALLLLLCGAPVQASDNLVSDAILCYTTVIEPRDRLVCRLAGYCAPFGVRPVSGLWSQADDEQARDEARWKAAVTKYCWQRGHFSDR